MTEKTKTGVASLNNKIDSSVLTIKAQRRTLAVSCHCGPVGDNLKMIDQNGRRPKIGTGCINCFWAHDWRSLQINSTIINPPSHAS